MASYSVHWILAALALLACALISEGVTGGEDWSDDYYSMDDESLSDDEDSSDDWGTKRWMEEKIREGKVREDLREKLAKASEPVKVKEILQECTTDGIEINGHTVRELAGLCELSSVKCFFDELKRMYKLGLKYYKNIPNLFSYANHCIDEQLNYCAKNIHELDEGELKQAIENKDHVRGEGTSQEGAGEVDSAIWKRIKENSELERQLTILKLAPEEVEEMFRGHSDRQEMIFSRKVAQWVEICEEWESRCPHAVAQTTLRLMDEYENIPQLVAYINYCVYDKVKNFCIARIDKVGKFLLKKSMSTKQQELVRPLVQYMKNIHALDKREDSDIVKAYLTLKLAQGISRDEEKDFRKKVNKALKSFRPITACFFHYLEIHKQREPKPAGDLMITEWLNVSWIAIRFKDAVSAAIKAQPKLFKSHLSFASSSEDEA